MYRDKYAKSTSSQKHLQKSKPSLLLITLIVLMGVLVGLTVAYLVANTDPIANSFVPAKITTEITEDFDNNVKNNVQVKNTGEVDAFIRVAVVVTWQNEAGEVYSIAPVEGTDYTVTYPTTTGWVKHTDGFYYYTRVVKPTESTDTLLTDCKPVEGKAPEGYTLHVEILATAIQSEPITAVKDAWKVDPTTLSAGGNA